MNCIPIKSFLFELNESVVPLCFLLLFKCGLTLLLFWEIFSKIFCLLIKFLFKLLILEFVFIIFF